MSVKKKDENWRMCPDRAYKGK
jgi:hypothetical protein